jgi:hypothetical protein
MKPTLLAVTALLLLVVPVPASDDAPLPGRDGQYQFEALNLEGTVWQGRLIPEAEMIVRFEHGGVLYYKYTNGNVVSRTGSWKQHGNTVYLETNNKYAEYTAVIRGNQMIGEAHNIRPFQWKWEMKRLPASVLKDDPEPRDPKPGEVKESKP